ncbi:Cystatin-11 [Heterocephalus glaber]|uniref:Cystatin-11 n=1 Tax=Heterocephalus glaber TaxID=10181 RepID=G5CBD3_HETGA|nr:cystatin-11 [Heterocephalus glaber]EHB18844.1 Cystatin-11 [Heterocephalus glaber]
MAWPWQALQLPLAILVVLVAFSDQFRRRTFISMNEETAVSQLVPQTLYYLNDQYNQESEDTYSLRIFRVLRVQRRVTDHLEYRIQVEMWRTRCLKPKFSNCAPQEGVQYKQIECYFSVYVNPWAEKYKILKKYCEDSNFPVAASREDPRTPSAQ